MHGFSYLGLCRQNEEARIQRTCLNSDYTDTHYVIRVSNLTPCKLLTPFIVTFNYNLIFKGLKNTKKSFVATKSSCEDSGPIKDVFSPAQTDSILGDLRTFA